MKLSKNKNAINFLFLLFHESFEAVAYKYNIGLKNGKVICVSLM